MLLQKGLLMSLLAPAAFREPLQLSNCCSSALVLALSLIARPCGQSFGVPRVAFSCRRGSGVRDLPSRLVLVGNFVGASFLTGGGGTLFLWPGAFLVDWLQRCSALASWRGGPLAWSSFSRLLHDGGCSKAASASRGGPGMRMRACELTSTVGRPGWISL